MADDTPPKQEAPPASRVEDIPDPDEDDLDDLDDVLDEFSAAKIEDEPSTKPAAAPGRPPAATTTAAAADDEDDFAKQLQAGMAELLGELGNSPEMQQQFESLVKELDDASAAAGPSGGDIAGGAPAAASGGADAAAASSASASKGVGEDSFQEQIRRTMERMQASGDQASAAAASSGSTDDILAKMIAEMENGGFGAEGAGEGSDEDLSKMLMGMMEQLTNKEILYEPMKELHDKLPQWLENNKGKVTKDDLQRYEEQQRCVKDIVERFERPGYSDESTADREYIVDRMQKMQAAGSPPPDLVGDMSAAQEALGGMDSGCATQ